MDFGHAFYLVGILLGIAGIAFWLIGMPLLGKLGEKAAGLYSPDEDNVRVVPEYSIAEARLKEGKFAEAIAEYRKGLEQYPDDAVGHVRIAEIYVQHLKEPRQ